MSTQVLTNAKIFVAHIDVSGVSNHVDLGYETEALDETTFGSGGTRKYKGGLEKVTAHAAGFWEASVATGGATPYSVEDVGQALAGSADIPVTIAPSGGDTELAYFFQSLGQKYTLLGEVGTLAPYTLDFQGRGTPLLRGTVMVPSSPTLTVTGNGTVNTLGAVSAGQKLYAAMHVFSVAGTSSPTLTMKIQSAVTNFATITDRVTFTAATNPTYQYATPVAGPITDTFWRASWTITGTNPIFTAVVVVAIQ